MSTREDVIAARIQVRLATQRLRDALDGQTAEERAILQDWARKLTAIESDMEHFLSRRAN